MGPTGVATAATVHGRAAIPLARCGAPTTATRTQRIHGWGREVKLCRIIAGFPLVVWSGNDGKREVGEGWGRETAGTSDHIEGRGCEGADIGAGVEDADEEGDGCGVAGGGAGVDGLAGVEEVGDAGGPVGAVEGTGAEKGVEVDFQVVVGVVEPGSGGSRGTKRQRES